MEDSTLNNLTTRCLDGDSEACLIVGDHYLEEVKDLQKALEFFKECQKLNHKDGNRRVGFVYHKLNDWESAKHNWLLASEMNDIIAIENLGRVEMEKGNAGQAKDYFIKAINHGSKSSLVYLGRLEVEQGNGDEGFNLLNRALELGQMGAHLELAEVYEKRNQPEKYRYHIFKGADEGNLPCISIAFKICYNEHSYEESLKYILKLEHLNYPSDIYFIGQLNELLGNKSKAREYYQKASDLGDAWGAARLAIFLFEEGNDQEAMLSFEKACQGGHGGACNILGTKYRDTQDYHRAKHYFDEAIKFNNTDALIERGGLELILGDYSAARIDFAKAIEAGNDRGYYDMGFIEMKLKNYDEALQYFFIAVDKGISQAFYNIGFIYSEKSDQEKAIEYFEKSIEAGNLGGYNALGCLEMKIGNLDKAREHFKKGIEVNDLYCNLNIAELELEFGDKAMGLEYLNPVIESGHQPIVLAAHELLIRFYNMIGDTEKKMIHEKLLQAMQNEEDPKKVIN